MREVIVETVGRENRTIQVGREPKKKVYKRHLHIEGIVHSPLIFPQAKSEEETKASRCWKKTKRGNSHARKIYQRHGERKPSRRRNRWGRYHCSWPSTRILNEMGRCIYPDVSES